MELQDLVKFQAFLVLCFLVCVTLIRAGVAPLAAAIPAPALVRTPSLDSAIIKSERLGGNFAYSTVEGHAYAAVSPVVQRVVEPVAVTYTARQVPLGYAAAPGPLLAPAPLQAKVFLA